MAQVMDILGPSWKGNGLFGWWCGAHHNHISFKGYGSPFVSIASIHGSIRVAKYALDVTLAHDSEWVANAKNAISKKLILLGMVGMARESARQEILYKIRIIYGISQLKAQNKDIHFSADGNIAFALLRRYSFYCLGVGFSSFEFAFWQKSFS